MAAAALAGHALFEHDQTDEQPVVHHVQQNVGPQAICDPGVAEDQADEQLRYHQRQQDERSPIVISQVGRGEQQGADEVEPTEMAAEEEERRMVAEPE